MLFNVMSSTSPWHGFFADYLHTEIFVLREIYAQVTVDAKQLHKSSAKIDQRLTEMILAAPVLVE